MGIFLTNRLALLVRVGFWSLIVSPALFLSPSLGAAEPAQDSSDKSPFAGTTEMFRRFEDSPAVSIRRQSGGEEIPIIDNQGRVVFSRPEDKPVEEMTEEDFYKTLTPTESAVLTPQPQTAPEWIRAAVIISRVGRKPLAKLLFTKSIDAPGTPEQFAAMLDDVGPDKLYALAGDAQLGDQTRKVIDRVMTESRKWWENPETIRQAFEQTMAGSQQDKENAVLALRKGDIASLNLLVSELCSEDRRRGDQAAEILSGFGQSARDALMVMVFQMRDDSQLERIAAVIAQTKGFLCIDPLLARYWDERLSDSAREALGEAIEKQLGRIPDRSQAAIDAAAQGMRFFDKKVPCPASSPDAIPCWSWDNSAGELKRSFLTFDQYCRKNAAEEFLCAKALDGDSLSISSFAALALAEETLYQGGLDSPVDLDAFRERFGREKPNDWLLALEQALLSGHEKGGIIPAMLLGETEDVSLVTGAGDPAEPTALVRAASAKDRRLRFTALSAIDRIDPPVSFPGCSQVINSLLHFSTASGKRYAVIGTSKLEIASLIGNVFADGSVRIVPTTTGGELMRLAQDNADVEYVVASSYLRTPDVMTIAQAMAVDYRTSDIPIFVTIEEEYYEPRADLQAASAPNAVALPLPQDRETGRWALEELYRQTNPEQEPVEVRLEQAKKAIDMLSRRLAEGQSFCEPETLDKIAVNFLHRGEVRDEARAFALGIGTSTVQTELVAACVDRSIPIAERKKFLETSREHIEKYGLRLRGPQLRQIDDMLLGSDQFPDQDKELLDDLYNLVKDHTN
ncbi:MAG: hypothetical protein IJH68_08215 [Thermoguttaceae bacterium]|nr:hypothetical protein [Thermoguttaceae bacterium]